MSVGKTEGDVAVLPPVESQETIKPSSGLEPSSLAETPRIRQMLLNILRNVGNTHMVQNAQAYAKDINEKSIVARSVSERLQSIFYMATPTVDSVVTRLDHNLDVTCRFVDGCLTLTHNMKTAVLTVSEDATVRLHQATSGVAAEVTSILSSTTAAATEKGRGYVAGMHETLQKASEAVQQRLPPLLPHLPTVPTPWTLFVVPTLSTAQAGHERLITLKATCVLCFTHLRDETLQRYGVTHDAIRNAINHHYQVLRQRSEHAWISTRQTTAAQAKRLREALEYLASMSERRFQELAAYMTERWNQQVPAELFQLNIGGYQLGEVVAALAQRFPLFINERTRTTSDVRKT